MKKLRNTTPSAGPNSRAVHVFGSTRSRGPIQTPPPASSINSSAAAGARPSRAEMLSKCAMRPSQLVRMAAPPAVPAQSRPSRASIRSGTQLSGSASRRDGSRAILTAASLRGSNEYSPLSLPTHSVPSGAATIDSIAGDAFAAPGHCR
jgi:hypothetical protein